MRRDWVTRSLSGVLSMALLACGERDPSPGLAGSGLSESPLLYVWAADTDGTDAETDFLAVIDADPSSAEYGTVVATEPVGVGGTGSHHAEPVAPRTGLLFANGFAAGRTFLFDLASPRAPRLAGELQPVPGFAAPHSFVRLDNGDVLATMQVGASDAPGSPGALARFDSRGRLLKVGPSSDPAFPGATIRPYALEVAPELDRVVTTSRTMNFTRERGADLVQVWTLSNLELIATLEVPRVPPTRTPECWLDSLDLCDPQQYSGEQQPFDARLLSDGTVLISTLMCAFYRVSGLRGGAPRIEPIFNWPESLGCSVPAVIGSWYIMPVMFGEEIVVVDVSDPSAPSVAHRVLTPGYQPHWIAADPLGPRVVVTSDGLTQSPRVLIYNLDPESGDLAIDTEFVGGSLPDAGVTFARPEWPHGAFGPAQPHAALFGR